MKTIALKSLGSRFESTNGSITITQGVGSTLHMTTDRDTYTLDQVDLNNWTGMANGHQINLNLKKKTGTLSYA